MATTRSRTRVWWNGCGSSNWRTRGQARGCHNVTIGTLEIDIAMFDELLVKVS
jgi:hypothetical protein